MQAERCMKVSTARESTSRPFYEGAGRIPHLQRAVPELPMHPRTVTPSLQKAEFRRDSLGRDDEEFPPEAWRERSLSFKSGIDEAFVAIHALVKPKATDYCRYLVKDRDGVARDVYAPTCASPLRLIFRLELSGVKMDYDLAQHQNSEPSVIVFMPSGNPEYNDLAQPLPLKCFWRPSDAMKKREHGIKEALASFQLLHIRFHPAEHSKEVREKMSWCRSLLDDLLKAFRRPEVREALTSKTDRKGVADAVKAVQKEVLPAHGLGEEARNIAIPKGIYQG
ncbi:Hypothetical protein (Fragment) [Durusdinium trenchii]|uniref:Uncharacterized protein n=1 Tax=Durusdinium trenchii TaxID=1381693 RepID=A0ABP0SFQ6_9DINO